jgi:hypothetical protein
MKLTVVTDQAGQVTATIRGHASDHESVGVAAHPNRKTHEIEVPDDYEQIKDAEELHRKVASHLRG